MLPWTIFENQSEQNAAAMTTTMITMTMTIEKKRRKNQK